MIYIVLKIDAISFLSIEYEALDKELDELNSELDKMENWSSSLHDKVAELLKETRQQNDKKTTDNESSSSSVAEDASGDNKDNTEEASK